MAVRVCLAGATGWAESELARGIARTSDLAVVAAVSRTHAGRILGEVGGEPRLDCRVYASAIEALAHPCDVFVEYTRPESATAHILAALQHGAHVVVGTSGLTADDFAVIDTVALARRRGVLADATGLVLAPGFIDAHNHSTEGLDSDPDATTQVSQGITTALLGQDGSSPFPVRDYLARRRSSPVALNVALLVGHATIRRQVMGSDFRREATAAEVSKMETLVDQEMRDGAIGLSSGLEYEVGSYASTEELVALARVAARHGGFYISHVRDEADRTIKAVREAIAIGERARLPVQITHIKLGTVGVWGKASEVVAIIEAARKRGGDVTADAYPYLAWHSNLKVLVPNKQWTDPASVKEALDDVGGGQNIQIRRLPKFPQYVGKRLSEVAKAEGISEVDAYIRIVANEEAGVIGHTTSEADMRTFYRQPWTMVASDGSVNVAHPRGASTFPRVLGRFVREEKWLTLPDAIRKMTSLPAARIGLKDRGVIRVGMKADLVIFDPATVLDLSTFEQPRVRARGIHSVFVNGMPVWTGDRPDGNRPGRVLGPEPIHFHFSPPVGPWICGMVASHALLVAQRDDRIGAHRAAGRDHAGKPGDPREEK